MMNRFRQSVRRLVLESLESREVPAANFQITSLTANNVTTVLHDAITGDDFGGIAVSGSQAFVTGNTSTGRFALTNLSDGTAVGTRYDGLTCDLKTQKVYALATEGSPGSVAPLDSSGGLVTHLVELDGATGALTGSTVPLSMPVFIGADTGIFAGYERVVLHSGTGGVYEIALPSGTVSVLNPALPYPLHRASNNGSGWYWGTTEHYGGQDYLDYAQDTQAIAWQRVSDGGIGAVAVFSNLADMGSFTVSPATGRWYFHHEGASVFQPGAAPGEEVIGFADATFQIGDLVVTSTADSGTGSLRDVINTANGMAGTQIIGFLPGVTGTINLITPIPIAESVVVTGPGSSAVSVSGTGANPLFQDTSASGIALTLSGLTLSNSAGLAFGYSLVSNGDLVITAGTGNVTFNGSLTVTGNLTLTDGNAVDLGPNTTLTSGTLAAANGVAVGSGDTLTGSGFINGPVTVQTAGKIAPQGVMRTGNLAIQSGGTLQVGLYGPDAIDRLLVTGTVNFANGANLNASLNYSPDPADSFLLINNNLTDPIVGNLNGVRNRSGLAIGGTFFQICYDGGNGNDVELLVNDAPVLSTAAATTLPTILEDVPPSSNPGTTVDALVATDGLYSDADGPIRSGIAVTGLSGASGLWQFSRNAGGTWTAFPAVSITSAVLLEADGAGQNRIRFLPNTDFFGSTAMSFKGWDTADGRADGSTGVNVSSGGGNSAFSSATESAAIQVLAVNDAPVAGADGYSLTEDGVLNRPAATGVLANDLDVDGPFPLTVAIESPPAHGSLVLNADGSFVYTPVPNYNGPDAFTYRVADSSAAFDIGSVSLTVTSVNDNPTANNDTTTATEDGGTVAIDVLANDSFAPDLGETLTVADVTNAQHGAVFIAPDGKSVRYTPDANYNGPDIFTYTIADGNGGLAAATVNVAVVSVNDLPDAVGDVATVNEDAGAQTIDLLANDSAGPDSGETLTIGSVTQGTHGSVTIAADGLSVLYTPQADYAGPDAFFYTLSDGNGGADFAAVTVIVANDAADRLEVVTSSGTATFTEGGGSVAVDAGARVGSALEGILNSASVRFASGYVKGKDKLFFAPISGNPIRGSFNVTTGILTLTGTASPADYQSAFRSVTYNNTSPLPVDGVRTLSFQVKDVAGTGDPATKLLRVIGVNTKPNATLPNSAVTYKTRGKPVAVASTLVLKDIDNTRLQSARVAIGSGFAANQDVLSVVTKPGITANYNPATGVLTLTGNATLATYQAVLRTLKFTTLATAPGGSRTLTLTVNDGQLDGDTVSRIINVV